METRRCQVYSELSHLRHGENWKGLRSIVKISATRYIKATGIQQEECRYYISSLKPEAEKIGRCIRGHWGIENSLHWTLDVAFHEDQSRKREGNAAENFSISNRIALNLIKNEKSKRRSVKGKRLDAGWDNDYLIKILKN